MKKTLNYFHKVSAFALCLVMLLSMIVPTTASTPSVESVGTPPPIPTTGDVWDGSIIEPTTLVQKDGVTYYEINKCAELAYVAQTGGDWLTYNYILGNNLILNDVVFTWDDEGNLTNSEEEIAGLHQWVPIDGFSGLFDGSGYTISGVYVDMVPSGVYDAGFFGYVEGNIGNVTIVNSYIKGSWYVGGIVSALSGRMSFCSFSGVVCASDTGASYVGGIIGFSSGNQAACEDVTNYAYVFGQGECVGGIIGYATNGAFVWRQGICSPRKKSREHSLLQVNNLSTKWVQ